MNPFEAMSAMPYENLYHMGIVVPDLDRAMADFSDQLGLTWAPRRIASVIVRDDAGRVTPTDVAVTYSRQGPPYFEIIEAIGDGVWSPEHTGRLHHLGLYAEDVVAECERLERKGFTIEVQSVSPDGKPGGFAYLRNQYGVRVELVAESGRQNTLDWVSAP